LQDLAAFLSDNPNLHYQIEQILSKSSEELEDSLEFLCSLGVFTQGLEFRCKACGHRSVFSVDMLTSKPACPLCGCRTQLPVQFNWHFFFDSFLSESIREHGTLPQIAALGSLLEGHAIASLTCHPRNY
jgi:hypothetical protein